MKANIPDFRVVLDGRDLSDRLRPRLISLSISERRGDEADEIELVIDDSDGAAAMPPEGAVLEVSLGWKQGAGVIPGLVPKGRFKVDEVEHSGPPDTIVVRGRSADFTSHLKTRREKTWHDTTIGAVAADIAGRNALQPRCAPRLAGIQLKTLVQSRESDMALLRRLGRDHDAVATIKGGALILAPIGAGETATGKPLPAIELHRRDGDRHSYRVAKREEAEGVSATWHDRKSAKRKMITVGKEDGSRRLARTFPSEATAKAAASAARQRGNRQPVSLDWSLALGRADISPEHKIMVAGFRAEIDAVKWIVGEATHTLTDGGLSSALKLERAR
ncbi:contractile injection system protein, VgrG/Pvc8 family [Sphingomonas sp. LT1P40]|uniref:contractile injection system protein, VgrG/Pvc8 family n=1 Tax=Alteristakelama amylovorans TaxID=3096166 RepID=UPI002FC7238D